MCRLLAYIGEPATLEPLIFSGEHPLYEQSWAPRELLSGSVNADGYGIAWYSGEQPARLAEVRPIWFDDDLKRTLSAIESGCVIAALRNGTEGIPVDRSGLLPLVHDRWCFVLNGYIPDFRAAHMRGLREALPDELYSELRGASDSETLFLLTVAELQKGLSMTEALTSTARRVYERVGKEEAQLNMVMTDGQSLVAVRSSSVLLTNSLYVAEHPPFAPDGVVLASEAPDEGAVWAAVDGHSWIEVDRTGEVRSEMIFFD